jgi:hypothetical protein
MERPGLQIHPVQVRRRLNQGPTSLPPAHLLMGTNKWASHVPIPTAYRYRVTFRKQPLAELCGPTTPTMEATV